MALWTVARADLSNFDCGNCDAGLRVLRGCEGGCVNDLGEPNINAGTRWASDTCPRRHLIRNPDLVDVLALHRITDGKPGLQAVNELTGQALEALAIVDDARAAKAAEVGQ